ncbi:uncharacterized protein LOC108667515 [Hyalella azteca]|uniref:Uncharacterized protein LOC108667515 n=1 Tax=Hyalella azteca TaxID=294128 RepID=A0A8B7N804_HYAAZ|nr:uncharacterized protein LOC108667515 [Hyalella azteca]XP_047740956.1 uncharacterized protein LOC108667515 [Hyalella azteca]
MLTSATALITAVMLGSCIAYINPGCKLVYITYITDDCVMSLELQGDMPSWLPREDVATEILNVNYTLLVDFATKQVCRCQPPAVSKSCPVSLSDAVSRLLSACPLVASTVAYNAP